MEFDDYLRALQREYAWLPPALVERYARAYGTRIKVLLKDRSNMVDMGNQVTPGLFGAEVEYLKRYEWATCEDDILWRRSKLGVHQIGDAMKFA
jgi:glycerol-3-phosphate dehydrogenase